MQIPIAAIGFLAAAVIQDPPGFKRLVDEPSAYGSWAPGGERIVYQSPTGAGEVDLFTFDLRTGDVTRLTSNAGRNIHPAWSPVDDRVAFVSDRTGNREVYVLDLATDAMTNVSDHPAMDIHPFWSPDGQHVMFNSARADTSGHDMIGEVYSIQPDGRDLRRLTFAESISSYASWSPSARDIVFRRIVDIDLAARRGNPEIFVMDVHSSETRRLTHDEADDGYPTWSPDGRRIVFASTRSGVSQIFDMAPDGSGVQLLLSASGNLTTPVWSPDGTRLLVTRTVDRTSHVYVWTR